MKNSKQTLKWGLKFVGAMFGTSLLLTSCVKKSNDDVAPTPVAYISAINLSPGTTPLNFYLDQNKTNSNAISFGQGYDYIAAFTGKRTAKFTVASSGVDLKSDTLTLMTNKAYSLFLVNNVTTPEYVLLKDTLTTPTLNKANVRFANFSPNAPAVDFAIKGGAVLAANKAFKTYTSFMPVDGNTKITIEVRQAGTTTVLASLTDITIPVGTVYTIWLQGLTNTTDQTKLAVNAQLNTYY